MAEYAYDINEVMRRIDTKDYDYFLNLSDTDLNKIVPLIVTRWQVSLPYDGFAKRAANLLRINKDANCGLWVNSKEPRLFLLSLCGSATGKYRKHGYFGRKKATAPRKADKDKAEIRSCRKDLTDTEFDEFYAGLSKDDISLYKFAASLG